jgi:hypothetical protein
MADNIKLTRGYICGSCRDTFATAAGGSSHNRKRHNGAAKIIHKAILSFNGLDIEASFRNGRIVIHVETSDLNGEFHNQPGGEPMIDVSINDSGRLALDFLDFPDHDQDPRQDG